ncbi:MAG: ABC transporter permease [Archangiaceae bacterium]|nr:ABC transporter permease [Archangiaceae bacterium]
MLQLVDALLSSTLDAAPALVFAALGAVLSERAGVVNVGVEGMMRAGAFVAAVAALVMPTPLGVVLGMLAGAALAALHAWLCIRFRADQVVSGMAINLVMLALGTFLLEARFSPNGTPSIEQLTRWGSGVPVLGGHTALTWLALAAPFALHAVIQRTRFGLRLRAAGEKPQAVAAMGVSVSRLRFVAVTCGGLLAGLGGASLSVATLDRFEHNMPAGLGFMAVAAMVFGRWTPLGAAAAAAFFAFGNALRIGLTSSAPQVLEVIPQGVLLALPYLLTLLLLAGQKRGAGKAPAALGTPYDPELR